MADKPQVTNEPFDRRTRIIAAATEAMEAHPEWGDDVRAIVFIEDDQKQGIQPIGYEGEDQNDVILSALTDLFLYLKTLFAARGATLSLLGLGKRIGRDS